MISKTAISYDLHTARQYLELGHAEDARRSIQDLVEQLNFLLEVRRNRRQARLLHFCSADDFGRDNVLALRSLCKQVGEAITANDDDHAQSVLLQAEDLWAAVPASSE